MLSSLVMIGPRKRVLFGLLAVCFGLAAGLLLGEALMRHVAPPWLRQRMNDLNLSTQAKQFGSDAGWSVERVGGRFVRFTPRTSFEMKYFEYRNRVNIDRWGGRVVRGNMDEDRGSKVPFLGDSFTFGVGVEDNQTFVSLLSSGSRIQFLNLGVPGCALPQQIDILRFRWADLQRPKACVFSFFTGNDFSDLLKYYSSGGKRRQFSRLPPLHGLPGLLNSLMYRYHFLGKSYLFVYVDQLLVNRQESASQSEPGVLPWVMITDQGKRVSNSIVILMDRKSRFREQAAKLLDRALEPLIEMSRKEGFRALFIILPDKHQVDPELLRSLAGHFGLDPADLDTTAPDRIVAQELDKYGIRYFDVLECLRGRSGLYYHRDDHFTPPGHAAVARCISSSLNAAIDEAYRR